MIEMLNALRVAVVGLEFGARFVPIYQAHPMVKSVSIADPRQPVRDAVASRFGIERVYESLEAVLSERDVHAVHIVTGLRDRPDHVVAALEAGKHVASAVPMALSIDDIQRIMRARDRSGTTYMMMETAVFSREYLFAEGLVRTGALGEVNYARGTHVQEMTNWPGYWLGLPPMLYSTHAVSPILRLLDARAATVVALGGGLLKPENRGGYSNEFAVESALIHLDGRSTVVEVTRSLFQLAHPATESFSIFGDRQAFESPQGEGSRPSLLHTMGGPSGARGRVIGTEIVDIPDRHDLLPEALRHYTKPCEVPHHRHGVIGGHGGSHPHLVHEFVSSILEQRAPAVDHIKAAHWTAVGIAAHQSACAGGKLMTVPRF
jgi:predicted dehydrogenase